MLNLLIGEMYGISQQHVSDIGGGKRWGWLLQDASGVTAIEYSLIAALIGIAAVAALQLAGTSLSAIFAHAASAL